MKTTTRLGVLHVQVVDGAARPVGVALANDGVYSDGWLSGLDVVSLGHDGTGWRVAAAGGWAHAHHTVRLWDLVGAGFATSLPVDDTRVALQRGERYELRHAAGVWELHQL